jgi:ribose transport system ATP-binding protein
MAIAPEPILAARGIRKSFGGVEVLHGVDLVASGGSVLALLGENGAGKSTLVKISSGVYTADDGTIHIGGHAYSSLTSREARDQGIAIISQEFQDAATLSVAENISLGSLPAKRGFVRWGEVRRRAVEILSALDVDIDPDRTVGDLRLGERQIIEIARALSREAKVLILDEPTAALSFHEAEVLFDFVRRLRADGVAIVYITHRLDEVERISDRVQVLRDGSTALEAPTGEVDRRAMVEAMIGRRASELGRPVPVGNGADDEPVMQWAGAGCLDYFDDVNLTVGPHEVVALYGKLGSGASEVAETAFGLRAIDRGALSIGSGDDEAPESPIGAVNTGIGYLPAERKTAGGFMVRPVAENVAVASWRRLARYGFWIRKAAEAEAYQRWHEKLSIRSRNDPQQIMGTLSGGNQQKVLLARWLENESDVLVLVEPTRGVDVGAREDIYEALRELASDGVGVLVVTSDYEEAFQLADRVYVMTKGAIVAELTGDEITTGALLELAGG